MFIDFVLPAWAYWRDLFYPSWWLVLFRLRYLYYRIILVIAANVLGNHWVVFYPVMIMLAHNYMGVLMKNSTRGPNEADHPGGGNADGYPLFCFSIRNLFLLAFPLMVIGCLCISREDGEDRDDNLRRMQQMVRRLRGLGQRNMYIHLWRRRRERQ